MPRRLLSLFALATLALAVGCGGGAPDEGASATEEPAAATAPVETFEVDPATAATVTGKVSFQGDVPKMPPLNMNADEDCAKLHDSPVFPEQVVVGDDGGLANAFVWVKSGLGDKAFAAPSAAVAIDQQGCRYEPHVVGIMVGQTLKVTNSDPTSHNVHPLPRTNNEWNLSQGVGAGAIEQTFSKPELMIPVKCNLHPWMRAYVNVSPHPFFAVTGADGSFEIKGLPPGEYVIEIVHEKYGNQEMTVTVGEGATETVDFQVQG